MYELIEGDGPYTDISAVQFIRWNPTARYSNILPEEVFCIG
jgi:hypothetical protein